MNENSLSIIIPVYKVESFLQRCIDSVLAQTYQNIEIILVDDGSPDGCPSICDTYAEKYDRVSVIHQENTGLAGARRAGFLKSKGDYVLFVDSDDWIAENMVEKLIQSAIDNKSDLVICGYRTIIDDVQTDYALPYDGNLIIGRDRILEEYIIPLLGECKGKINIPGFLCIRLLKKCLIQESFFGSEREFFLEDHYFDLLYADSINRISIVNEQLYYYCVNRQSLSNCYRENKWQMYKNIYCFYSQYISKRCIIDTDNRLESFLLSAVINCIDNAVLSGNYQSYKKEISTLREDKTVNDLLRNIRWLSVGKTRKAYLALLRNRWYKLLYTIRKSRIEEYY